MSGSLSPPLPGPQGAPDSPPQVSAAPSRVKRVKEIAHRELKEFMVVFIYLWVIFALFDIHKAVILAQHNMDFTVFGFAFVNALALGKVMLIGQELNLAGNAFKDKPLIYPILLKSFVFAILLFIFKVIEEIAMGIFHGKNVNQTVAAFGSHETATACVMAVLMFVMLTPFFTFVELSRHMGEGRLTRLFLHSRDDWFDDQAEIPGPAAASTAK
jgi:hypothetical protein